MICANFGVPTSQLTGLIDLKRLHGGRFDAEPQQEQQQQQQHL